MSHEPRRARSLFPIVMLACLAAMAAAFALLRDSVSGANPDELAPKAVTPTAPATKARVLVHALARLAPEAGIINVGVRPGVRIDRIEVKEGDEVATGAELAVLEGRAQAELQVALAEAQKKNADDQRTLSHDKLVLEREREDKLKKDRLDTQKSLLDVAKRRLDASKEIYKTLGQAATGKVKYDLDLAYFQAEAEHLRAQIELKEVQVGQDLIERRRQLEDRQVEIQEPDRTVLDRQLEVARAARDQTVVLAPAAGRVLEVSAHAGEASQGMLLSLADLSAMVAIAEVYQSDLPDVKVGDPAEVLIQGRRVAGRVTKVSRLVGRNTLASLDPRALQDRRVVPVTIRLDDAAAAADYVNMEVEVTIRPQSPPSPDVPSRSEGRLLPNESR
jgi:HlyD family secretion protein